VSVTNCYFPLAVQFTRPSKITDGLSPKPSVWHPPVTINLTGKEQPMNNLFTTAQYNQLIENGSMANRDKDHIPVTMLTLPFTACIWLLTELDPDNPDIAFGLCDLGMGFPELGYVSISEIQSVNDPVFKMTVFNNTLFKAEYPISAYAEAARVHSEIVWDKNIVARYVRKSTD
jgi:hypothetical protein